MRIWHGGNDHALCRSADHSNQIHRSDRDPGPCPGRGTARKWFHWDRFPYRTFPWEEGGRIYETIGIRRWKDRLPDKSKHTKKTFTKQMKGHNNPDSLIGQFLPQETCVAEFVHWCLLLLSFPLYSYVPTPFGAARHNPLRTEQPPLYLHSAVQPSAPAPASEPQAESTITSRVCAFPGTALESFV